MVDAVVPFNLHQIMAQNAGYDVQYQQAQLDKANIQQELGLLHDIQSMDPNLSLIDKMSKSQDLAISHGQLGLAAKIADGIAATQYKVTEAQERLSATAEKQQQAEKIQRDNVLAAIGRPDSESDWNQAKIAVSALYPNLPPALKKLMDAPWTPQLQKWLANYGMDPKKQAEVDKDKAETGKNIAQTDKEAAEAKKAKTDADTEADLRKAQIAADRARAADSAAAANEHNKTASLTDVKRAGEEARAKAEEARAALDDARREQVKAKTEADAKNGGPNVKKLTDATKGDKEDVDTILKAKFPKMDNQKEAIATIAAEAKARQAKEGGDLATATKKIIAENPGRIYKFEGKYVFKDLPSNPPPGYSFQGKVSKNGNRVWEAPGKKPVEEVGD